MSDPVRILQLAWSPAPLPPLGVPCLCRGESYDAKHSGGYFVAYTLEVDGRIEWRAGKQQETVTVTDWAVLP